MPPVFGVQRECDKLVTVLVKRPQEAFGDQYLIDTKWERELWLQKPDFNRSAQEHFNICRELKNSDVSIRYLPAEWVISMNSIFTRDSAIITPNGGYIKCALSELGRFDEPTECGDYLEQLGLRPLGEVEGSGLCRGSDFLWLNAKLLVVALSKYTNDDALEQIRAFLEQNETKDVEIVKTAMNCTNGMLQANVRDSLHCGMSVVASDTIVICPERFEGDFLEQLRKRGYKLISVSVEEWKAGAAEILMVEPKKALIASTESEDPQLERIKRILINDLTIDVNILTCPNLRFSKGGLKSITLPLYRLAEFS